MSNAAIRDRWYLDFSLQAASLADSLLQDKHPEDSLQLLLTARRWPEVELVRDLPGQERHLAPFRRDRVVPEKGEVC